MSAAYAANSAAACECCRHCLRPNGCRSGGCSRRTSPMVASPVGTLPGEPVLPDRLQPELWAHRCAASARAAARPHFYAKHSPNRVNAPTNAKVGMSWCMMPSLGAVGRQWSRSLSRKIRAQFFSKVQEVACVIRGFRSAALQPDVVQTASALMDITRPLTQGV